MELGLAGRGALVGGASKGLGRAVAEGLAAEGCRVVLWSRGGEALEAAAAEIRAAHGAGVHTVGADARDPDAVTINGVLPGRFLTDRTVELEKVAAEGQGRAPEEIRRGREAEIAMGRYGLPEELAALAVYLCSEPARYQTGTLTAVDGGLI